MNNIELFKQDVSIGDIVTIELTSRKSITGRVSEINDCVVIEKEDGKKMRLLDGIIGGWEKEESLSPAPDDVADKETAIGLVSGEEDEYNDFLEAKENEDEGDEGDDDDEDENENDEDVIEGLLSETGESLLKTESMKSTKLEVLNTFNEIFTRAGVDDEALTPANAKIYDYDSTKFSFLAQLDNGNQIRFTKSTLVGFYRLNNSLVGCEIFSASVGVPGSIVKSKRNLIRMPFGQLRTLFHDAVEKENFGQCKRIARTIVKFPELTGLNSSFKKLYASLLKLRTLKSYLATNNSLTEPQRQLLLDFVSDYLAKNPSEIINYGAIRSAVITNLGLKVSKVYITYLTQQAISKARSFDDMDNYVNSVYAVSEAKTTYSNLSQEEKERLIYEFLQEYKRIIIASDLRPSGMIITNAKYVSESEYSTDYGIALMNSGEKVYSRKTGFVGEPTVHLKDGSPLFVRYRSNTGDSVTTIGLMTYNTLNQYYAASVKSENYWEAISILTYLLHSVPEVNKQSGDIKKLTSKLMGIVQERYPKDAVIPNDDNTRLWLESFIRFKVANENIVNAVSDEEIKDLFCRRFNILLPRKYVSEVRKSLGISDVSERKETTPRTIEVIDDKYDIDLYARLSEVFSSVGIDITESIPTNAVIINEGIGYGIKAKTDDGRTLDIQAEFFAGNPIALMAKGVRVYTKPQPSGQCYVTVEEMTYGELLEFCKEKIFNNSYQAIISVVKVLRSIPRFESEDDTLKAIYYEAKIRVKKEINKSIRTYDDLSEEEKSVIYTFVKDSISMEETNNPLSDFQLVNAYNEKFGILLHTAVISTIRKDLGIPGDSDRRIESSDEVIESNCLIDKYFAWYNNGAAYNSMFPEIRFKDEVVDPLLLPELKKYRKGDPAIPAVCNVVSEGRYKVASFIVRPGKLNEIYQTARFFETAGNLAVANAIKSFITKVVNLTPPKESSLPAAYTKARNLRKSHDYSGAEEILLSLIRSHYQLDTVVKDLADMYREMGHLDKAVSLMETHLDELDNKLKAFNFISNLYSAVGDYSKSIFYLRKAYDLLDPKEKDNRVRCLMTIANQSIVLKDTETAKEVLQEAIRIKPNAKARELLSTLNSEKKSDIGKLKRVLSFKAPEFIENDLKLSNYQKLSEEAAEFLIKAKEYQEKLDQKEYRKTLLAYVRTRCIDLLKSDRLSAAQDYMLCGQAINNTAVNVFGIMLLQSQIVSDPIVLIEQDTLSDFGAFLSKYTPCPQCERVLYRFLKCFEDSSVPLVMNALYDNEEWNHWICSLIGTEISNKKLFRDTLIKKADLLEKNYKEVISELEEVMRLGDSYDMSEKIISLLSADCIKSLNDIDSATLTNLSKIVQSVNDVQKLDDYQVSEERSQSLKKKIEGIVNDISDNPTRISSLYIVPILERCAYLLDDNLQKLSIEKAPDISIVSASNARVDNETGHIQLKMSNKTGHSKIISASVRIISVNGRDVSDKQYLYNLRSPLYGGRCYTFEIVVSLNPDDIPQRILNLLLSITYFDKDSTENTVEVPLEIRIDDSRDFKPYENKFVKYANGQEVRDSEMVKGRDGLINTISETAQNDRKSFIIFGQRRSGKSTVLLHVGNRLKENKKCFVVPMSMLSLSGKDNTIKDEQSFLGDLYFQIFSKIARQIKLENRSVYKKVFDHGLECDDFLSNPNMKFTYYLEKVQDVLHDELGYEDERIILIIDEFTALYYEILEGHISDSFIKKTKELSESGSITFIVSGHDVMPKFWERYPNEFAIFKKEPVTSIDEKAARELVEEPVWDHENDRSRFEKDAVTRIIELSGYSPFYIQILCAEIVDYAIKNRIPIITEYDVNVVVNRMTSSEAKLRRGDFDNLIPVKENKEFHERVFELSIDDAYNLCKEIAQFEPDYVSVRSLHSVKNSEKQKVLSYLLSRDVVEPHPEYGRDLVKIKVSLFKEWLRKNE